MKTKYVSLFESYLEQKDTFESVYNDWKAENQFVFKLNENDSLMDYMENEEKLSSGEARALKRGLSLLTKPQMAAIYLFALGKTEGKGADYLKMIDGIEAFGYNDETDASFFNITIPALADAIGMNSDRTLTRTINKFKNLIDGVGETQSEVLYDKIIKAYEVFSQENPNQVALVAAEALQDPTTSTLNRDKAETRSQKAATSKKAKEEENFKLGESVFNLIKGLLGAGLSIERALPMAISKVAKESNLTSDFLNNAYRFYLKKMNLGKGYV